MFDSSQVAISGATSVVIDDSSITNPSSDILVNAANYGTNFTTLTGTYSRTGTTVTATVTDHNLTQFFTINNAFSSDPAADPPVRGAPAAPPAGGADGAGASPRGGGQRRSAVSCLLLDDPGVVGASPRARA